MAEFTGESASHANKRAQRNGTPLAGANRSQLIEFVCDQKTRDPRGRSSQLYSRDSALALLHITTNFTRDWTQEKAVAAVTDAFDWVESNGDTNPGRLLDQRLARELETNEGERKRLQGVRQKHVDERDELRKEQQTISEQQAEYRRMVDSKLFTPEELADPAGTGQQVAVLLARQRRMVPSPTLKPQPFPPTSAPKAAPQRPSPASWQTERLLHRGGQVERVIFSRHGSQFGGVRASRYSKPGSSVQAFAA